MHWFLSKVTSRKLETNLKASIQRQPGLLGNQHESSSTPFNKQQGAPKSCVTQNVPKCLHMSKIHLTILFHKSGLFLWLPEANRRHRPRFHHTKVIPQYCSIILSKPCQRHHDAVQVCQGQKVTQKNTQVLNVKRD